MTASTAPETNEDGFTLIDMVVSMVIGGLLTIMIFNLFNTGLEVSKIATQPVADAIATQPALDILGKAVRNSPDQRVTEDGKTLYVLNQENQYTMWHVSDDGLSNGSRIFKDVQAARFEETDGVIEVALTTASGEEFTRNLYSRFSKPAEGESVFTDHFLATHAPTN